MIPIVRMSDDKPVVSDRVRDYLTLPYDKVRFDPSYYIAEHDKVTMSLSSEDYVTDKLLHNYSNRLSPIQKLHELVLESVALLGAADIYTILALIKLTDKYYGLDSTVMGLLENRDRIRESLKYHCRNGFFTHHNFTLEDISEKQHVALYCPTHNAVMYLRHTLSKNSSRESFLGLLPPQKLAGRLCANTIALAFADSVGTDDESGGKVTYNDGFFNTYVGGHLFMDCMLDITCKDSDYLVGVTDLYTGFTEGMSTDYDYEHFYSDKLMLIDQFLHYAKTMKRDGRCIVVFPSWNSLEAFISRFIMYERCESLFSRLVFTSEVPFREDFKDRYLYLSRYDDGRFKLDCTDSVLY